ncbi:MAG: DNA primase [Treponemataceae bacterium]
MSRIAESTIQEVNNRADAFAVIGEYVRLEKKGGRYWGLCPFHNEKTASFSVEPDRKFYYCFGCGKGGGLISFVQEMDKLSFPEAVESLAARFGVEVIYEGGDTPVKSDAAVEKRDRMLELYDRVAGSFHHILKNTESAAFALEYLRSRAISEPIAEEFMLGYAPADRFWLHSFLSKKGYSSDFLAESGLFIKQNVRYAFFADRLIFPIADRRGRTVAFGGRILHGEGPKYLNSSESELFKKGENLFALNLALPEIRKTKKAYICEGYMDVIALHQAGVKSAVAPLGTAFTESQARLLLRWAERVFLVFDSDQAGINAAEKGILTCRKVGLACSVVTIKDGKDPADILLSFGPEALQKAIECYINDFDYLLARALSRFGISDSEGKAKAVAFMFPFLEMLDSEVSRDACVGAIADAFGVDRKAVAADFAGRSDPKRAKPADGSVRVRIDVKMNDELFLLLAVVVNRGLYRKLRTSLSPEDVDDLHAKELFVVLEECFRNESEDLDGLLSAIADEDLRAFVLARSASDAFTVNPERIVADGITRIKQKSIARRGADLLIRIRTAKVGGPETSKLLDDLLIEKMHIDDELSRLKDVTE